MKALADDKTDVTQKLKFVLKQVENILRVKAISILF